MEQQINKIFGIGMSKTGTTSLGEGLRILGFGPHKGFDPYLKKIAQKASNLEIIFKEAECYRSFDDSPWYHHFKELDQRFPGSKFILTVRKDSASHAQSSWDHGVRAGKRVGKCTTEYFNEKVEIYEKHNAEVMEYFKDRPADLLVVCFETQNGWEALCPFLGVEIPAVPFPHLNRAKRSAFFPKALQDRLISKTYLRVMRDLAVCKSVILRKRWYMRFLFVGFFSNNWLTELEACLSML